MPADSPKSEPPPSPPESDAPARPAPGGPDPAGALQTWVRRLVEGVLMLAVLAAAVAAAWYWIANPKTAERKKPQRRASLVEVRTVTAHAEEATIEAMGTVIPARQMQLAARVGGQVSWVSEKFVPGGRFDANEVVLKLDPVDYQIAVNRAATALERARLAARQREGDIAARSAELTRAAEALKVEQGAGAVARREYELLGEDVTETDQELILRRPQLATAEAAVQAARAAVESAKAAKASAEQAVIDARNNLREAELALQRTVVRAPFDGTIRQRYVNLHSEVASKSTLADFVGTGTYWVRVSVPLGRLRYIRVPGLNGSTGSAVDIYHASAWGPRASREGRVVGLEPGLEPQGRMARLLIAIDDPLELKAPRPDDRRPLVLDAYVDAVIHGQQITGVYTVPRTALREKNRVWVMNAEDRLEIRQTTSVWTTAANVYVDSGLSTGERLIVSDLPAPVEGMDLRVRPVGSTTRPDGPTSGSADPSARRSQP